MEPEKEIKKLLNEFLKIKDNIFLTERLFVAVSVLNWAFLKHSDKYALQHYLDQVKKHLRGEITLYWEDGTVRIHRGKK